MPRSSRSAIDTATPGWQQELAAGINSVEELAGELDLPASLLGGSHAAGSQFPLRVPRGFVRRMRRGDPRDPLLLQIIPTARELTAHPGFVADPLDELTRLRQPGLLQKYQGRALLMVTGACAVHCRYCFRREFPYVEAGAAPGTHALALAQVARDPSIQEVILSGGDPLSLSNTRLHALLRGLEQIDHVRRIRIHSRTPVVLPERIDTGLVTSLGNCTRPIVMVLHSNHANELDATVATAVARLRDVCATVLNQSVLLRGINDDATCLADLSQRLFEIGVLPYYIHQLDTVRGTAHFRVADRRARRLLGELAARLPGYLVPRLVRERPGMPAKEILAPVLHNPQQVT